MENNHSTRRECVSRNWSQRGNSRRLNRSRIKRNDWLSFSGHKYCYLRPRTLYYFKTLNKMSISAFLKKRYIDGQTESLKASSQTRSEESMISKIGFCDPSHILHKHMSELYFSALFFLFLLMIRSVLHRGVIAIMSRTPSRLLLEALTTFPPLRHGLTVMRLRRVFIFARLYFHFAVLAFATIGCLLLLSSHYGE